MTSFLALPLMTFPMGKTPFPQLTFIAQAEIQVQEESLKKKKEKGTLTMFLMAKKHTTQLTFIAQAEIQVQEVSPKEKKEKGTLMTFLMAKKRRISTYFQSPNRNQRCKKGVL